MQASADNRLSSQYGTANNLSARIHLHASYSTNPRNWQEWVFDQMLAVIGTQAKILEVGCGRADLWNDNFDRIPNGWKVHLTDQSSGMLMTAQDNLGPRKERFTWEQRNIDELGDISTQYDAVIANHMLYHVVDRNQALEHISALLEPDGKLIATTNGRSNLATFRSPEIMSILYPQGQPKDKVFYLEGAGDWFHLEDGDKQLNEVFPNVRRIDYADELRVKKINDLIAYHRSYVEISEEQEGHLFAFYESIRKNGIISIPKVVGMFVAEKE